MIRRGSSLSLATRDFSSSKIGRSSRRMRGERPTPNVQRPTSNSEKPLIRFVDLVAGNDEGDLFDGIVFAQKCRCRIDRDFGGGGDRIAICATTDRWKCNRPEFVGHGELQ